MPGTAAGFNSQGGAPGVLRPGSDRVGAPFPRLGGSCLRPASRSVVPRAGSPPGDAGPPVVRRTGCGCCLPPEVERRRALVPVVSYPDELPVSQRRDDIAAAIRDHQVVIVAGETGSGKTTQLPKICLELGRGVDAALIGHTQPRRIAARVGRRADRRGARHRARRRGRLPGALHRPHVARHAWSR